MCIGMANGGKIRKLNLDAEQALGFFKEELKDGKCDNDCLQCNSMEIAINALEKQIPKKVEIEVVEDFDESTGEHYKWRIPKCSVCGEHIGLKMHKYCAYCGQALDWSGAE